MEELDYKEIFDIKRLHGGTWNEFILDVVKFYRDKPTK